MQIAEGIVFAGAIRTYLITVCDEPIFILKSGTAWWWVVHICTCQPSSWAYTARARLNAAMTRATKGLEFGIFWPLRCTNCEVYPGRRGAVVAHIRFWLVYILRRTERACLNQVWAISGGHYDFFCTQTGVYLSLHSLYKITTVCLKPFRTPLID
jgi:hypothetical protein